MAEKKKPAEKENEPGFFSDYGYGNGKAITLHDPPQKPKNTKAPKTSKPSKGKRK